MEAVVEAARHFRYEKKTEPGSGLRLNRVSELPDSKENLKRALKDRIRDLCAAYISLASFVPDEDANLLLDPAQNRKRARKVLRLVLWEMGELEKEMREFDPLKTWDKA